MDFKYKGRFPIWKQFRYSAKHRGIWNTLSMGLAELRKDWELGIYTLGNSASDDLTKECGSKRIGHFYQPSSSVIFEKAMNELPFNFGDKVFLDIGSGKGRALILAAEAGFRKVIGIEYSAELNVSAQSNIAKVKSKFSTTEFVLEQGDALLYDIPSEVDVIYFFNPFDEAAVRRLLKKLTPIFKQKKRVFLVYVHPVHSLVLEEKLGAPISLITNWKGMPDVAVFSN